MKVLCVSGFTEKVGDGSGFWGIADALESIFGVTVIRRQWDTLTTDDLTSDLDVAVTYSYGQAAFWHALFAIPPEHRPNISHLFIIAGVPRFWFGQFYGLPWHIPNNIAAATAFNVDSIPHSAGIHNADANYVNVDCNAPGVDHVSIQSLERVQDAIVDEVAAMRPGAINSFIQGRVNQILGNNADSPSTPLPAPEAANP